VSGIAENFTSIKLTWMNCLMFDRRNGLMPIDKIVAVVIMQAVNEQTRCGIISDETIADLSGGISTRNVQRARKRLRAAGWLRWHRTGDANHYRLHFDNLGTLLDAREARRGRALARHRDRCDTRVRSDTTLESDIYTQTHTQRRGLSEEVKITPLSESEIETQSQSDRNLSIEVPSHGESKRIH